jgi:PhnB protein
MLDKIMHARLVVSDKVLMVSDAPPDRYHPPQGFSVTVGVETPAKAERIYNASAERCSMALRPTFFAERFGMLKDKFGTP